MPKTESSDQTRASDSGLDITARIMNAGQRRVILSFSGPAAVLFLSLMLFAWAHFALIESHYRIAAGLTAPNLHVYEKTTNLALAGIVISGCFLLLLVTIRFTANYFSDIRRQQQKIQVLEQKVDAERERVRPAWDLARVKLEAYFDRNLKQVQAIFVVAIFVMCVGFGLIVWGLQIATSGAGVHIATIASASGIITEFVSLTFMAIYKATMAQANQFVSVLERINTVGMAVQILDSMEKESSEIKDITRGEMIKLLLATPSISSEQPNMVALKTKAAGQT
jgi:hypothetical protein